MRLLIAAAMAFAALIVAVGPGGELLAAPKPANPRVKITFSAGSITHDGQAEYRDGVGGVTAYIDRTTGVLNFGTGAGTPSTSARQLQFAFTCIADCIGSGDPPVGVPLPDGAPYSNGYTRAHILAGVRDLDGHTISGGLLNMPPGVPLRAGIHLNMPLDDDPAFWTLCMNAGLVEGFCAFSADSTWAHVIRTAPGTWTISATAGDIAELMNDLGSKGRVRQVEYLGTYSMPFSFTVQQCLTSDCS